MSPHSLEAVLSLLSPWPPQSELVRAAMLSADEARRAWMRWCGIVGDPHAALTGDGVVARNLLPLLCEAARREALPMAGETLTYVRSARVRESLRAESFRAVIAEVLDALVRGGIECLLVRGAAVGELFYDDLGLRHTHDVELLVRHPEEAAAVLRAAHLTPTGDAWVHRSGLPFRLHGRLVVPSVAVDEEEIWRRAITSPQLYGGSVRTLDPADALALVLIDSTRRRSRVTGRWACDAASIMRHVAVDWSRVASLAIGAGSAAAVLAQLRWLTGNLDVAVPATTLEQLEQSASELEFIVRGICAGRFSMWREVWRNADASTRRILVRSLVAPSPGAMGWRRGDPVAPLLRDYAARPFRYAAEIAANIGRKTQRSFPERSMR